MSEDDKKLYENLENRMGACLHALSISPAYSAKPLGEIMKTLLPAVLTKQHRVVKNDEGKSVGYISWAMIDDTVREKLTGEGDLSLSDWQSGETGFVVDAAAENPAAINIMVARLKNEVFKDKPLLAYRLEKGKKTLAEVPLPS